VCGSGVDVRVSMWCVSDVCVVMVSRSLRKGTVTACVYVACFKVSV